LAVDQTRWHCLELVTALSSALIMPLVERQLNRTMSKTTTVVKKDAEAKEHAEVVERSYAEYHTKELAFDPMKDLNLPASYEEVLARFKRLQGDKAMESLN